MTFLFSSGLQVLRFSQHHLELVSKKEYALGRPLEEEEEEKERSRSSHSAKPKEVQYGLITKNGRLVTKRASFDSSSNCCLLLFACCFLLFFGFFVVCCFLLFVVVCLLLLYLVAVM